MRRFIIIGFIFAGAIVGVICWQHFKHPSDAQIRQMLAGTWEVSWDDGAHGTIIVSADDRYEFQITDHIDGKHIDLGGTLQVKDGFLIDTMTKNSQINVRVPNVSRGRIIRADGNKMVVDFVGGNVQLVHYRKLQNDA